MSKNNEHISKLIRELQDAKETQWKAQFRAVEDAVALLYTISGYDGDVLDNAIESLRAGAEADADSGEAGQEWAEFIFETLGRE